MSHPLTKVDELSSEVIEGFKPQFSGPIIKIGDESYDTERQVWNKMIDKKPGLIARCSGAADVTAAVNFARENNLITSIRSGGHNVAGNSMNDGGIVIDLSHMKAVWVDPKAKSARVQGGATWAEVDRETQAFGLACAGGVVSTTGVAGLTLGGGLGWTRRNVGMSIDNLISADIVLADGTNVTASTRENEDLFWAIRGGGGNFGIVTSFEFQLQELGPDVFFCSCMYPASKRKEIIEFWLDFIENVPNEITLDCSNWSIPVIEAFPPELQGQNVCVMVGLFTGVPAEGEKIFQSVREITEPLLDLSGAYPYTAVQQMFDPFFQKNAAYNYWKCLYLDEITDELVQKIVEWVDRKPSPETLVYIRHLQGAISEVKSDATAFGDRSAKFLFSIDTGWTDPAGTDKNIQWTKDFFEDIRQYSKGQVYFNFHADLEVPSDVLKDSYGSNYERLVSIKTKYDPHNFFNLNANIKPLSIAGD